MTLLHGDSLELLKTLKSESVQTCITSPPYWGLRDYGVLGQLGLEKTPQEYVENLVNVFREVRRVLRDDGTLWLNLGDSYATTPKNRSVNQAIAKTGLRGGTSTQAQSLIQQSKICGGLKPKDLCGIPWRVALALQADGWYLRQDIIWHKPNPMPESVTDRCTKAHEYIFLLSKSPKYFFDMDAIKEPAVSTHPSGNKERKQRPGSDKLQRGAQAGSIPWQTNLTRCGPRDGLTRHKRSVWTVTTKPFKGAHFATFPPDLIEPCILAGSRKGDTVLDPFFGAGTTGVVAKKHGRECIGIELNPEYLEIAKRRIEAVK